MKLSWAEVLAAVRATLTGVVELTALVDPDRIRQVTAGDLVVPSVEMTLIADTERELVNVITIQFDLWFNDWDHLLEAERLIRQNVSSSLPMTLNGVGPMWALYRGSRTLGPPDDDTYNRSFDIRYEAIRTAADRYR